MFKRPYVLAVVSFVVIPVVTVLAGMLINSIDPEIAVRTSNYERNFWLLTQAKNLCVGSLNGDCELVVSHLFFSGQVQATIVWLVALGHAWPVWIDYPDPA